MILLCRGEDDGELAYLRKRAISCMENGYTVEWIEAGTGTATPDLFSMLDLLRSRGHKTATLYLDIRRIDACLVVREGRPIG